MEAFKTSMQHAKENAKEFSSNIVPSLAILPNINSLTHIPQQIFGNV
jgi:hypothetical protein